LKIRAYVLISSLGGLSLYLGLVLGGDYGISFINISGLFIYIVMGVSCYVRGLCSEPIVCFGGARLGLNLHGGEFFESA